jgi:rhodanese-related sulfurtransferase
MRNILVISIVCVALIACSHQETRSKSVDDYKAAALAVAGSTDVATAIKIIGDDDVVFVDVREAAEITRNGKIAGAVHVPRGVLEFQIDPASSMHNDVFSSGKKIIFYCVSGGRSMLVAGVAAEMGLSEPVFLEGGFKAWAAADVAIDRESK